MTIEARMRASAAASAARVRAQQKQLEYVRGAMEQAAEEGASEEAKAAAAKAGAAEAAKDIARLKRQRDADQAMEAKAAESAGAMKSGMDDLKEAINQVRNLGPALAPSAPSLASHVLAWLPRARRRPSTAALARAAEPSPPSSPSQTRCRRWRLRSSTSRETARP